MLPGTKVQSSNKMRLPTRFDYIPPKTLYMKVYTYFKLGFCPGNFPVQYVCGSNQLEGVSLLCSSLLVRDLFCQSDFGYVMIDENDSVGW